MPVRWTRLLTSALLAGAVVAPAGCAIAPGHTSGVAQVTQSAAATHSARAAHSAPSAGARSPKGSRSGQQPAPDPQLGIDLDYYLDSPARSVPAIAAADVAYVRSLHANALSVSFPFFMHGPDATTVYGSARTPTPAELAVLVSDAEKAGLYVSIRPLLDEKSLHYPGGRTKWTPVDMAAWFASYEAFLQPYAQMAEREHVPEMFTGVEFNEFLHSAYWGRLDAYLRRYYHGTLAYSDSRNWELPSAWTDSHGVIQEVDAYKPIRLPPNASIATLTRKWDGYLGHGLHHITISELGISAQDGAYYQPYSVQWFRGTLDPEIQVRWFTAACNAAARYGDGLYFWSINFANQFAVPPGPAYPAAFIDSPGAQAIAACFQRLR
jgi:hypothetical protein